MRCHLETKSKVRPKKNTPAADFRGDRIRCDNGSEFEDGMCNFFSILCPIKLNSRESKCEFQENLSMAKYIDFCREFMTLKSGSAGLLENEAKSKCFGRGLDHTYKATHRRLLLASFSVEGRDECLSMQGSAHCNREYR